MKTLTKVFYFSAALIILAACGGNPDEEPQVETSEKAPSEAAEIEESKTAEETEKETDASPEESAEDPETDPEEQQEDPLSAYSSEQIEYARVWLQLGANQDIDGLYVNKIPAGTPLNADDETSGTYPEDVIQLAGSRLVDGSVTYSGNGDGTINVYNVPLRWDGQYPAGEDFYKEMIENTELVAVDVGDDAEVIRLIELLEGQ